MPNVLYFIAILLLILFLLAVDSNLLVLKVFIILDILHFLDVYNSLISFILNLVFVRVVSRLFDHELSGKLKIDISISNYCHSDIKIIYNKISLMEIGLDLKISNAAHLLRYYSRMFLNLGGESFDSIYNTIYFNHILIKFNEGNYCELWLDIKGNREIKAIHRKGKSAPPATANKRSLGFSIPSFLLKLSIIFNDIQVDFFDKHRLSLDKLTVLISPASTAFLRSKSLTVFLTKLNLNNKIVLIEDLKINITENEVLSIIFNYVKLPLDPLNRLKSDLHSCFINSKEYRKQSVDQLTNFVEKEYSKADIESRIYKFKQKLNKSSFKVTDLQIIHLEITKEALSGIFTPVESLASDVEEKKTIIMTANNLVLLFKKSLFDLNFQSENINEKSNLNMLFEQLFQLSSFTIKLSSVKAVPNSEITAHSLTLIKLYLPILSLDIIYNAYMNLEENSTNINFKEKILFDLSIVNPLIQVHFNFLRFLNEIIFNIKKKGISASKKENNSRDSEKHYSNSIKAIGLIFNNLKKIIDLKMSVSKILLNFVSDIPLSKHDKVVTSHPNGFKSYRSLTGKINKIYYELNHMKSSFSLLDFKINHNYTSSVFNINEIKVCKDTRLGIMENSVNDNILFIKDLNINLSNVDLLLFFYGLYIDFSMFSLKPFQDNKSHLQNELAGNVKEAVKKERRNLLLLFTSVHIINFTFAIACNKILPDLIYSDNEALGIDNKDYNLSNVLRGFQIVIHEVNYSRSFAEFDKQLINLIDFKNVVMSSICSGLQAPKSFFGDSDLKKLVSINQMQYSFSHKALDLKYGVKKIKKLKIDKMLSELDISVIWLMFVMNYLVFYIKTRSQKLKPKFFTKAENTVIDEIQYPVKVDNNLADFEMNIAYCSVTLKLPPNDTSLVFLFNKTAINFKNHLIDNVGSLENPIPKEYKSPLCDKIPCFTIGNVRVYAANNSVISQAMIRYKQQFPTEKPNYFCALNIDDLKRVYYGSSLKFSCHRFQLYLPFKFLFYQITDSLSLTVKAIKQIKANFEVLHSHINFPDKTNQIFKNREPEEEDAKTIINTTINIDRFRIDIKDNDFESELSLIYKIGLIEQKQRLEMLKLFNEKSNDYDEVILEDKVNDVLNNKSNDYLAEKRLVLYKHFSKSWIRLFQVSKRYRDKLNEQNMFKAEHLPNLDIEEIYNLPSLIKLTSNGISFSFLNFADITNAESNSTTNLADFLYIFGKKIPKDTSFNLLIPLHIKIQSTSGLKVSLRDYPLPLIFFPDFLTIEGSIVFAEELNLNPVTRRNIPISFCDSKKILSLIEGTDNKYFTSKSNCFYASLISRSLNPVKTYLDLKIINNNSSSHDSMLVWGKSLQPTISTVMQCFDNLSKPPIDKSPIIGWWDKFRLIMHGRFQIQWKSKINLIIKGSRDPYQIIEDGSGFNFCFNNNVKLLFNSTFRNDELLVVKCDAFVFGIPQFKRHTIAPSDPLKSPTDIETYEMVTSDFKKVITLLNGNIVWKAGMLFEREYLGSQFKVPGNQERTFEFKPHYLVERANPNMVSPKHDSYKDFRSDYIHLAIGVENLSNVKNSFHLTPLSVRYFRKWWALFNNSLSLPLRQGKIFSLELNKKKFGTALYTIKYKINLESIFISHVLRYTNDTLSHPNEIHFAGLKMKSKMFALDLHQRKQKVMYTNETLKLCKHVWHLTFNDGKIDCEDNEVKFISTIFKEISTEDLLIKSLGIFDNVSNNESSSSSNNSSTSNLAIPIKSPTSMLSDDYWIDFNDYIELEFDKPKSRNPKFKTVPLFKTPRCTYIRQNDQNIVQQTNPFGNEHSHLCNNFRSQESSLIEFIQMRSMKLEGEIKKFKAKIQEINNQNALESKNIDTTFYHKKVSDFKYGLSILKNIINEKKELLKYASVEEPNFEFSSTDNLYEINSLNGISSDIADDSLYEMQRIKTGVSSHLSFSDIEMSKFREAHSKFNNRFIVNNLLLKWNNELRNNILKFVSQLKDFQSIEYFLGRKLIKYLQSLQKNIKDEQGKCEAPNSDDDLEYDFTEMDDRLHEIEYHYLLKLVCPQIQFQSVEESPNTICLLLAQDIELQSLNILSKGFLNTYKDDKISHKLESRSQLHLKEMQTFIVNKEDTFDDEGLRFHQSSFGGYHNWPTWIHIEGFYDSTFLSKCQFSMKTNGSLKFNRINNLFINPNVNIYDEQDDIPKTSVNDDNKKDLLKLEIPKFEIFCTSNQFDAIYTIVTNLIVFEELKNSKTFKRLKGLVLASNFDLNTIDITVHKMQQRIRELITIKHQLELKEGNNNDDLMLLSMHISKFLLKLLISVRAIQNQSYVNKINEFIWNLQSNKIEIHLLNDNYLPLIDLRLEDSKYIRVNHLDNSATNVIHIGSMRATNLKEKTVYPELLESLDPDNFSKFWWKNNPKVGGISVMEFLIVNFEPLKFQIDNETAKILFNFVFPNISKKSSKNGNISVSQSHEIYKDGDNQYTLMAERSAKYINFNKVEINKTELWLSYKGHSKISDIENLVIKIPLLEYYNHICSFKDLALMMKKDILKVLIHHAGEIISTKFKKSHKGQPQYHKRVTTSSITAENTASNTLMSVNSENEPSMVIPNAKRNGSSFEIPRPFRGLTRVLTHSSRNSNNSGQSVIVLPKRSKIEEAEETLDDIDRFDPNIVPFTQKDL